MGLESGAQLEYTAGTTNSREAWLILNFWSPPGLLVGLISLIIITLRVEPVDLRGTTSEILERLCSCEAIVYSYLSAITLPAIIFTLSAWKTPARAHKLVPVTAFGNKLGHVSRAIKTCFLHVWQVLYNKLLIIDWSIVLAANQWRVRLVSRVLLRNLLSAMLWNKKAQM